MKTNRLARNVLMILGLTLAAAPALAKTRGYKPDLTILLFDYAGLPAKDWAAAQETASRILGQAGVTAGFLECHGGGMPTGQAECEGLPRPAVFQLRLFRPKFAESRKQLGYTVRAGESGAYLTIFVDPQRPRARVNGLAEGVLIGHAIAHEMGHLLLGPDAHSSSGIMRPTWRPCDEEWMVKGALQFDSRQAKKMRTTLLAQLKSRELDSK